MDTVNSPYQQYNVKSPTNEKMYTNCKVLGCSTTNANVKDRKLHFFRFPKELDRCRKWVEFCQHPALNGLTFGELHDKRICSLHFPKELITVRGTNQVVLQKEAVPTLITPDTIRRFQDNKTTAVEDIYIAYNEYKAKKSVEHSKSFTPITVRSVYEKYAKASAEKSKKKEPFDAPQNLKREHLAKLGLGAKTNTYSDTVDTPISKHTRSHYSAPKVKEVKDLPSSSKQENTRKRNIISNSENKNKRTRRGATSSSKQKKKIESEKQTETFYNGAQKNTASASTEDHNSSQVDTFDAVKNEDYNNTSVSGNQESFELDISDASDHEIALLQQLKFTIRKLKEKDKYCVVSFATTKIREMFYYNAATDKVDGFVDLGRHGRSSFAADTALVFMVKGINRGWKQPFSYYFFKDDLLSEVLPTLIVDVIERLLEIGVKPKALVCEQTPLNVEAVSSLSENNGASPSPCFDFDGSKIYVFYDPLFLLKEFLDTFHKYDVMFHIYGVKGVAKWEYFESFYETDQKLFNAVDELTEEHANPIGRPAAISTQVFSHAVHATMAYLIIAKMMPDEAIDTSTFIKFMNHLYKSFNGCGECKSDKALQCDLSELSFHQEFWKSAVFTLIDFKFVGKDSSVVDKPLCQSGWIHNIKAICMLWEQMLEEGINNLNMQNFSLNIHRTFVEAMRKREKCVENPTCAQFSSAVMKNVSSQFKSKDADPLHSQNENDKESGEKRVPTRKMRHASRNETSVKPNSSNLSLGKTLDIKEFSRVAKLPHASVAAYITHTLLPADFCADCRRLLSGRRSSLLRKGEQSVSPELGLFVEKAIRALTEKSWSLLHEDKVREKLSQAVSEALMVTVGCPKHSKTLSASIVYFLARVVIMKRCRKLTRLVSKKYRNLIIR